MSYPVYAWKRRQITVSQAADLRIKVWFRVHAIIDTLSGLHLVCRAAVKHSGFTCPRCAKVNRLRRSLYALERTIEDLAAYEAIRLHVPYAEAV